MAADHQHDPTAATVQPWQRPLLALIDKLRANPGATVKYAIGRKREGWIIIDRDGRPLE